MLTGVSYQDDQLGAAAYDEGKIVTYFNEKIEGYYHGTGDIFASAFEGAYLKGLPVYDCLKAAVDFTHDSILRTYIAKTDIRFGVDFESGLKDYAQAVETGGRENKK